MAESGPTTNQAEGLAGVHPSGASYAVQNVVLNVDVGGRLNLPQLASRAPDTEYGAKDGGKDATGRAKKFFDCATLRIQAPRATAKVYASGKMVVTGTKSLSAARLAVQNICGFIEAAGFEVDQETVDATLVVNNIVVSCSVGFSINLDGIHREHHACATNEPEKFSGLTYRMPEPKVAVVVFRSGKFNLTGVKREEDINTILDNIYPVLAAFRLKKQSIPQKAAPAARAARRRTAASAAAAAAGAGPAAAAAAAGPRSRLVSSSGGNGITQTGPSSTEEQQQQQQQGLDQLLAVQNLLPGQTHHVQQQQQLQQETKGLKRLRSAAEVLRAAASAGRLPPSMAARAAAGNLGLRLGEVLTTAGTAQPNPTQQQVVVPPAGQQQLPLAGAAPVHQPILQHQQQLGFPWSTAAFQPHALGTQLQAPAAAAGVMGLQGLLPQQQQLLGELLQQQLLQQQQQQPQYVQQPRFMQQQQQQLVQQQRPQYVQPPSMQQQQQQQQFVQDQQQFAQQLQQQDHPADPTASQQGQVLAGPTPSEDMPPPSPFELPSEDSSPVHNMPPATPPYEMPPATPPWEMPPASPAHRFDA